MRSDRNGGTFSLLVMMPQNGDFPQLAPALGEILQRRLRSTDRAGLVDRKRVGVLLPDTPSSGAWKVAREVCSLLKPDIAVPQCDVFVYPEHRTPKRRRETAVGKTNGHPRPLAAPAKPADSLFVRSLPGWKRALDIAGATVGLILGAPIMAAAALAIKCTSPGPLFFTQIRDGIGGRRFRIYKFRTMRVGADAEKARLRPLSDQDGPAFKLKDDPRITPVGRVLRRTSVDELPQLWNVLRGDMSLVGPRPLPSDEAGECTQWQRRRLDVTPGLTCFWQVHGGARVSFVDWMRMDVRYVSSRSIIRDLLLIALTVPSIILRKGVY
jgi:lipopolysaccharide/colanic/teichoic acid biosynthesis glycosyltransferase